MDQHVYQTYIKILHDELIPALGCTEPIAIAYTAAKARAVLGEMPDHADIFCSGNIIKNTKGVTVPNSGGLKGIDIAAVLGIVNGNANKELEVLEDITEKDIETAKALIANGYCHCGLQEDVENLYISVKVSKNNHYAKVTVAGQHTQIIEIVKDDEVIYERDIENKNTNIADKSLLNIHDILLFANEVEISEIYEVIHNQITFNWSISEEGLTHPYGAEIGKTLLEVYGKDVKVRAKARAAAGSDARMNGCSLPVVINSGSGNQGMTVSLPVIEFAKELGVSDDKLYRALVVSNLVAIHQKKYIGSLSAYCGAVSAACGAGAAITYLYDGTEEEINCTIINTIGNVSGILCDGAKSSCAAKIASSVEAAILAHSMAQKKICFHSGDGIIQDNAEKTIQSIGYIGRVGMRSTDKEILNIMIDQVNG